MNKKRIKPELPELTKYYEVNGETGEFTKDILGTKERVNDTFEIIFDNNFYSALAKLPIPLPLVFWKMVTEMDSQNRVFVGKPFKLEMIHKDKINLTEDSISNQIYSLAKYDIIRKLGYNYYAINPNYIAKGNMYSIAKLRLQYDEIGATND